MKQHTSILRTSFVWIAFFLAMQAQVRAQVEHVPIAHPVYEALMHWEARGILPPDVTLTVLPLQRQEIMTALKAARAADSLLTAEERSTLAGYEHEFRTGTITPQARQERSVVFPSRTDSTQVLFARLFSADEKFLFSYTDSNHTVSVVPLAAVDARLYADGTARQAALLAQVGGRIFGTLSKSVGFLFQAGSGRTLGGTPAFLLADKQLAKDFDFRVDGRFFYVHEAQVRFDKDWFYATVGRETRVAGAGYFSRLLLSDNAPAIDAISLGARFEGFEYRTTYFSMLGQPEPNPNSYGAGTFIPSKYMTVHRASFRGSWGELGLSETMIYSRRGVDMGYVLPIALFRVVSGELRDRDNYLLNFDLTLRPWRGVQFKGTFVLDDLRMPEVGRSWWGNKWAWNAGVMLSPAQSAFDATVEYTRVEPYTFSHFDIQNAFTNDGILCAGSLPPNSDELTGALRWWWGGRYPLVLTASLRRHGDNITDAQGNLLRNVGGSAFQTLRFDAQQKPIDSERVVFLDGNREHRFLLGLSVGIELARQWNVQVRYQFANTTNLTGGGGTASHQIALVLRFEDGY